ncbi:hypothetical protein AUR64_15345 [Haloprofundus marisrubri]|uniref:Uncharacterized protein n=1 Tax=Haloprofundus marisrubri TaxID=1514971 RepID=A0A0W1R792_9EURY|nr:hypothetical protein [Haloprofundus marisrubri]KTG09167.1 hypothetical protein AUR64_15345 [Haloprofundus marisrubri]
MSDGDEPSDTMRGRVGQSRLKLWLLMDASRWFVAAIPLGLVFASLVILGVVDPAPIRGSWNLKDPIETTFQGFLTAIITGVTLVVTINQLVLSQELGPLGDQRERMGGALEFREDVEDVLDVPAAPPEPSAFLRALVEGIRNRAEELKTTSAETNGDSTEDAESAVSEYVDGLVGNADGVSDQLEEEQFGTFDVLFAALNFNYSWKIYEGRRLRNQHEEALSTETREQLDELIKTLKFFGPAREHFKTLYFQWELINLSRAMMYASVPALIVTTSMILYADNPVSIPGFTFGVDNVVWVVSGAVTVALVPFMILLSYVLRIATVAKRTLSIGPFILRSVNRSEDLDWE